MRLLALTALLAFGCGGDDSPDVEPPLADTDPHEAATTQATVTLDYDEVFGAVEESTLSLEGPSGETRDRTRSDSRLDYVFRNLEPGPWTARATASVSCDPSVQCTADRTFVAQLDVESQESMWLECPGLDWWSCADTDTTTSSCFTAGTPVRTPTGDVPIEALNEGDWVLAMDERSGRVHPRRVAATLQRQVPGRLDLVVDQTPIEVTEAHPFWVPAQQRWVPATELRPGDRLRRLAGPGVVRSVASVPGTTRVFNLTVAGPEHTYFAHDVLVHNKDYLSIPSITSADAASCIDADTWLYAMALVDGYSASSALVNAWQTGPAATWNEEHGLDVFPYAASLSLADEADPAAWVSGLDTPLACGVDDTDEGLVVAYRVYDYYGDLADCWLLGHQQAAIDEVIAGTAPAVTPVTDSATLATCQQVLLSP